jgi:hypothetical protein
MEIVDNPDVLSYKSVNATCVLWRLTLQKQQTISKGMFMHALSTLILRHPEKRWMYYNDLSRIVTMDIIEPQLEVLNMKHSADTYMQYKHNRSRSFYKLNLLDLTRNRFLTKEIKDKYIHILFKPCVKFYLNNVKNIPLTIEDKEYIFYNKTIQPSVAEEIYLCTKYGYIRNFLSTQPLSEEFIREHQGTFVWSSLSRNCIFTLPMIMEFINCVDWPELSSNHNLTFEFIMEHFDKFNLVNLLQNNPLAYKIFEARELCTNVANFRLISFNDYNPLWFIEKYESRLDAALVMQYNKNISLDYIMRHYDDIKWDVIANKSCMTIEWLETHFAKFKGVLYDD